MAGAVAARVLPVRAPLLGVADVEQEGGFRLVTAGGLVAVLVWVAASAGFAFYVSNFGSYNETYGSIGGVIVFLVWLWISNIAVLLGAVMNAEIDRARGYARADPGKRRAMSDIRYWVQLPTEQFPPSDLVRQAQAAERAGFDALNVSDHYQPWWEPGHSGHAWALLGAIGQATSTISIGTGVTAPVSATTRPSWPSSRPRWRRCSPGARTSGSARASP